MVKGVKSFILSITVSAVGWVSAVRPDKNSTYQIPEFIRKRLKLSIGLHYEFLYKKLQEIGKREVTYDPIISSRLKLSLELLDHRFRDYYVQNDDVDRIVSHGQVDFWATYLGFYNYSLSFYEDLILKTIVLLSSDPKSKQELLCEALWREFFIFDDDGKIELQQDKFLLPILQVLGNLTTLPEGSKLVQKLGLTNWILDQTSSDTPSVALESWRLCQNLKSSELSYSDKVYPLIPSYIDEEPLVDIIFIHGIKGGAAWTWRQQDSEKQKPLLNSIFRKQIFTSSDKEDCSTIADHFYTWIWPLDWLKKSVRCPARLIALNYQSDWWKENNIFNVEHNLEQLSEALIKDLKSAGVGNRPIIWVTHSLGGLLLKNILLTVSKAKEKESLKLCGSTKGIVFYSVPHFGSPLSSWTYLFSCVFKPSSLLYCMTSDKSYLIQLHENFLKTCDENDIRVLSINETKPASITAAGPKILFVSPESGNPGIGAFHAVDRSHLDVCKPIDKSTPSYAIMHEFIIKLSQCLSHE